MAGAARVRAVRTLSSTGKPLGRTTARQHFLLRSTASPITPHIRLSLPPRLAPPSPYRLVHSQSAKNDARPPPEAQTPMARYDALVKSGQLKPDEHQTRIVQKLERLYADVLAYKPPALPSLEHVAPQRSLFSRVFGGEPTPPSVPAPPADAPKGLYLFGDVGTGKTMLMDLFFHALPAPPAGPRARRAHFHAFMVDVHQRVHAAKRAMGYKGGDPIPPVARDLAAEAGVLCFDEFQVTDVADAMILRRLMESLLGYGVVCVITSNRHPDDLYKNGIQRASFVPCIELLKSQLDVTDLDSGTDYRRLPRALSNVYHSPLNVETRAEVRKQFAALAGADVTDGAKVSAWGRAIHVPQSGAGVAWFEFADLCGSKRPLSAADYLEITKAFHTVFVTEVPKMDLGSKDMARRLITFVDACYESKTKLFVNSEVPIFQIFSDSSSGASGEISDQMRSMMDDLGLNVDVVGQSSMFTGDEEMFAFARCCSRLVEMGSRQWAAAAGAGGAESG